LILNWWEPLTVSVIDVDVVVCGGDEDGEVAFEVEENEGLEVSR
jgi:hypothetical protein